MSPVDVVGLTFGAALTGTAVVAYMIGRREGARRLRRLLDLQARRRRAARVEWWR